MSQFEVVEKITRIVSRLPEQDATSLLDYANFLLSKHGARAETTATGLAADDALLLQQVAAHVATSPIYAFLHDPAEDVYTLDDLKVRYR